MKSRSGFVSNSSSSSFIVIENDKKNLFNPFILPNRELTINHTMGKYRFGWEDERSYDVYSKMIFCWIQAMYIKDTSYLSMLDKVIMEYCDLTSITWDLSLNGKDFCYIDHQSAAFEGQNLQMFKSEGALRNFLFNTKSYIQTDNDNK